MTKCFKGNDKLEEEKYLKKCQEKQNRKQEFFPLCQ